MGHSIESVLPALLLLVGFPVLGTLIWFVFGHDIDRWILAGA